MYQSDSEKIFELQNKVNRLEFIVNKLVEAHPKLQELVTEIDEIPRIKINPPSKINTIVDWK